MLVPCKVCSSHTPPPDPIPASKYKCPKCTIPYCSVACYKSHQCQKTLISNPDHHLSLDQLSQIQRMHSSNLSPEILNLLQDIDKSVTTNDAVQKLHQNRKVSKELDEWCASVYETAKGLLSGSISQISSEYSCSNSDDDSNIEDNNDLYTTEGQGTSNSLYIVK